MTRKELATFNSAFDLVDINHKYEFINVSIDAIARRIFKVINKPGAYGLEVTLVQLPDTESQAMEQQVEQSECYKQAAG